mmetsp:Transcript_18535/g.30422  ORF Transcript_18535/g.30422 Transcript_18535/m.30422 type:complete len:223 (-) Transcript_18535:15330-15998(-)
MQKHTQTIDSDTPSFFCCCQQICSQWSINQIGHHCFAAQAVQRYSHLLLAHHTQRGCVYDQCRILNHVAGLDPIHDCDAVAKIICEFLRPHPCAIGQENLWNPGIQQRSNNRPGGTTGTQNGGWPDLGQPIGCTRLEVFQKSVTIRIIGVNFAIFAENQCICSPNQGCAIRHKVSNIEDGFLVRDCDVHTNKTRLWQRLQHIAQIGRAYIHRDIITCEPVGF